MNHLVILPILVPLLGAALSLFVEHRRYGTVVQRSVGWGSTLVVLGVAALLFAQASEGGVIAYLVGDWVSRLGITLVADAGLGDKLNDKTKEIFDVDQPDRVLPRALEARGIAVEDVTHFVFTHMHFDHAGGNTFHDAEGRPAVSVLTRWVSGASVHGPDMAQSKTVEIVPDRESYQPGDTAWDGNVAVERTIAAVRRSAKISVTAPEENWQRPPGRRAAWAAAAVAGVCVAPGLLAQKADQPAGQAPPAAPDPADEGDGRGDDRPQRARSLAHVGRDWPDRARRRSRRGRGERRGRAGLRDRHVRRCRRARPARSGSTPSSSAPASAGAGQPRS